MAESENEKNDNYSNIQASHIGLFASPRMGKTFYLLTQFEKMIFITFVPHRAFEDHVKALKEEGRSAVVIVLDDFNPTIKLPEVDVLILDCSNYRSSPELQHFFVELIKRDNLYSTIAMDEIQTLFPQTMKQSERNEFLDFLSKIRNYGKRVIFSSQRVQSVSAQAIGLCNAFVLGKVTERNAMKIIDDQLTSLGFSDYIKLNAQLKQRQFVELDLINLTDQEIEGYPQEHQEQPEAEAIQNSEEKFKF